MGSTHTEGTSSPQNARADINAWTCVTVPTGSFAASNLKKNLKAVVMHGGVREGG